MPANYKISTGTDLDDLFMSRSLYTNLPFTVLPPTAGSLWSWGSGGDGVLGLGNTTSVSSPVQVGSLSTWTAVQSLGATSPHILALRSDGTLWAWGSNGSGQLGLGDRTNRSSPVQVGSLTNWRQISAGQNFSVAIKTDGTMWSWGSGSSGKLGDGTAGVSKSSPVQIGSLTNWSRISCGSEHTLATKTDGTLWAWGFNQQNRLGLGDLTTSSRSSPTQVGNSYGWTDVVAGQTSSMAIKSDGTLWGWGDNTASMLGLGDTTERIYPTQVGSLTNWKQVHMYYGFAGAVKTDGTLWMWGSNSNGRLGFGDLTSRSSPVQVGLLTNWSKILVADKTSVALKTDGTLWAWGYNGEGQLGLGDLIHRSSPVQVGSLTGWTDIEVGAFSSYAIYRA